MVIDWEERPGTLSQVGLKPWDLFLWVVLLLLLCMALESQTLFCQADDLPPTLRLIKGDGEVLEEIVTKERHREINKVGGTTLPVSAHMVSTCSFSCFQPLSFLSKPPEGMAWPSRCERACFPEGPAIPGV